MKKTLFELLSTLEDPRDARGVRHSVSTILKMVVLGFAAKLVSIEHIVNFMRPIWDKIGCELGSNRKQPPDATTVRRTLEGIDREDLEKVFRIWVGGLIENKKFSASVDGKASCNSGVKDGEALKILNIFAHDIKLALAQVDIPKGAGESTTLQKILPQLFNDYPGLSVLTGDAAFCGRSLCQAIKDAGRQYMIQVKGNQGEIYKEAKEWFGEDIQKKKPNATLVKKNPRKKRLEKSG